MIEIPFLEEFKDKLSNGTKTATTRTKKYGKAGEVFTAFGMKFEIMDIVKKPLDEIRTFFFDEEGFSTPTEFEIVWNKIHPKGFESQKDEMFYFHTFTRIDYVEKKDNKLPIGIYAEDEEVPITYVSFDKNGKVIFSKEKLE